MDSYITLQLNEIIVPERIRQDLGGIEQFAASLKVASINPLTVNHKDDKFYLVCGERRLEGFKYLGLTEKVCHVFENLSDDDCVLLEMAENNDRKKFTDKEARAADRIYKKIEQKLEREFSAKAVENSEGRPQKAVTAEKIAAEVKREYGIKASATTVRRNKRHVEVVEAQPELAGLSQNEALKAATPPVKEKPQKPDAASRLTPLQTAVYDLKRAGGARYLLDVSEQGKYALCDSLNVCIEDLKAVHREMRAALVSVRVERKPLLRPFEQKKGR